MNHTVPVFSHLSGCEARPNRWKWAIFPVPLMLSLLERSAKLLSGQSKSHVLRNEVRIQARRVLTVSLTRSRREVVEKDLLPY